jgi:hypothetical protein
MAGTFAFCGWLFSAGLCSSARLFAFSWYLENDPVSSYVVRGIGYESD